MGKNSRQLPKNARDLKNRLWRHLGERCFYCENSLVQHLVTGDHVFPRAAGYSALGNIVPSCHKCNEGKEDNMPDLKLIRRVQDLYDAAGETFDPVLESTRVFLRTQRHMMDNVATWNHYCWQARCPEF